MKYLMIILLEILPFSTVFAHDEGNFFVSYELLEMGANNFKNFAGDIGCRFDDKNQIRFVVMEVDITEEHLSSPFMAIVSGSKATAYMKGYELNYDYFFSGAFYLMANIGYIDMSFQSTVNSTDFYQVRTATFGSGIGYKHMNLFGTENMNLSIPIRYMINPFEETVFTDFTVNGSQLAPSVWCFLGYEF